MKYSVLICIFSVLLTACSDGDNDPSTFKAQTDALSRANEVEDKMEAAARLQRQAIEDSTK